MPKLSDLIPGQKARLLCFKDPIIGAKLLDMGCVPGELLQLSKKAPLGCPIAIEVLGYELSLRKKEAETVEVDLLED